MQDPTQPRLQVVPVAAVDPTDLGRFLSTASRDTALCDATYLPPSMSDTSSLAWAYERLNRAWALRLEGALIGWFEINPVRCDCGFDLPPATFEREVWLLPHARGRRLVQSATELLRPDLLAAGVEHLVGVAWASNTSAISGMRNAGFHHIGRGWWEYETYTPGWCDVWLLALR